MATQVFRVKTRGSEWSNLVAHIDGVIRPITSDGGECRILVPCDVAAAQKFIAEQEVKLTAHRQSTRQGGRRPNPVADMVFALPTETDTKELTPDQLDKWSNGVVDWVRERFPASHLVNANLHLDEATPHMHVMIVPVGHHSGRWGWSATFKDAIQDITGKTVQTHPKPGESKQLMSKMQDDCWERCGKPFGLARGEKGKKKYREQIDRQKGLQQQRAKAEKREAEIRKKEEQLRALEASIKRDEELLAKQVASEKERQKKHERQLREAAEELGKYLVAVMFFLQMYYEKESQEPNIADIFILVFQAVMDAMTVIPKLQAPPRRRRRPDNVPREPYISVAVLQKKRRSRAEQAARVSEQRMMESKLQEWWDEGGDEIASRYVEAVQVTDLEPPPVDEEVEPEIPEPLDEFDLKAQRLMKVLSSPQHVLDEKEEDEEEPTPPPRNPATVAPVKHVDVTEQDDGLQKWRDAQIEAGRLTPPLFDAWVKAGDPPVADERDENYEKWLKDLANTSLRGASEELRELVVDHARPIATELGLRQTRKKGDRTRSKKRAEQSAVSKRKEQPPQELDPPNTPPNRGL